MGASISTLIYLATCSPLLPTSSPLVLTRTGVFGLGHLWRSLLSITVHEELAQVEGVLLAGGENRIDVLLMALMWP